MNATPVSCLVGKLTTRLFFDLGSFVHFVNEGVTLFRPDGANFVVAKQLIQGVA